MKRDDDSKYLLYIEPPASEKLKAPINDELTELMEMALSKAKAGSARYSHLSDMGDGWDWEHKGTVRRVPSWNKGAWMGTHKTDCGEYSTCQDYLLENGMITNSLAPFYLRWYRYSIPESDMRKIYQLKKFYKV